MKSDRPRLFALSLPAWLLIPLALQLAAFAPASSPDRILFTSTRDGHPSKLYVMDSDGRNVRRIGSLAGRHGRPEFSADNRRVFFDYSPDYSSPMRPYEMALDGSNPAPVARTVAAQPGPLGSGSEMSEASAGPGGGLVFSRHVMVGNHFLPQIFKAASDGSGAVRLTTAIEMHRQPAWCPRGGQIAYVNYGFSKAFTPPRHDRDGIYLMDEDGSNARRIVALDFSRIVGRSWLLPGRISLQLSRAPSFSADCSMLTFSLNSDGTDQIYVVGSDGSGLKQLTFPPGSNSEPSFSR